MSFDRVIVVDWSAASRPGPRTPKKDQCWIAWSDPGTPNPDPEYFRTRRECASRVLELARRNGRTLVGFDFPFGYPTQETGSPLMPVGRALCAELSQLVIDEDNNANNRFEVAGELNRRIRAMLGIPRGPFWGHPRGRRYNDLTPKKPAAPVPELRRVEQLLLSHGIQSVWKLAYPGSVGSQTLTGLPAVHHILSALGDKGGLWPFDPSPRLARARVVIAEIWPTLAGDRIGRVRHEIKDARQVVALRDAILEMPDPLDIPPEHADSARAEGWIVGASRAGLLRTPSRAPHDGA